MLGYRTVPGPTDRILHHARVVKTLVDAGLIAPVRPDRLALAGRSLVRWGTTSAGAVAVAAAASAAPAGGRSTSSARSATASCTAAPTRSPARSRRTASAPATASRSCAATTAASWTPRVACPGSAPTRSTSTRRSPRPQLADVVEREGAKAIIYDEEFAALLGEVRGIDKRFVAWHDGESAAGRPAARGPDRRRRLGRRPAVRRARPRRDPHVRHDRHAEGRRAAAAAGRSARPPRCCRRSRSERARRR